MCDSLFALAVCLGALALSGCGRPRDPAMPHVAGQPQVPLIALPPAPRLSDAGYRLILDYEVGGGRAYYDKRLSRPTWPGEASGVTVGVGYDCGYSSRTVILNDWHELPQAPRLAGMSGMTGTAAKGQIASVHDILIEWELAEGVFDRVTVTRFMQLARRTYPGFDNLRPNAQAALVSLTFNRGSSMTGDRRREMREIRDCVPRKDYAGMARANRESIRVWKGTVIATGMKRRREAEAKLMESP